jgi:hypothetical protein
MSYNCAVVFTPLCAAQPATWETLASIETPYLLPGRQQARTAYTARLPPVREVEYTIP